MEVVAALEGPVRRLTNAMLDHDYYFPVLPPSTQQQAVVLPPRNHLVTQREDLRQALADALAEIDRLRKELAL